MALRIVLLTTKTGKGCSMRTTDVDR
jgi:hypothetical protein